MQEATTIKTIKLLDAPLNRTLELIHYNNGSYCLRLEVRDFKKNRYWAARDFSNKADCDSYILSYKRVGICIATALLNDFIKKFQECSAT